MRRSPGPLGRAGTTFNPLSQAYSIGYVVCGVVALLAAVLAVVAVGGRAHETLLDPHPLVEE